MPIDEHGDPQSLLRLEAETVGKSFASYRLAGRQWALPIDAATQVQAIRPDLPVAIASGYISEELRREAPAAGVDEIIYKPDTVEALCQAIEKMMAGRRL